LNRLFLSLAALLMLAAPTWGQVKIATVTTITCETPVPAGVKATYDWYGDAGLTLTPNASGIFATPSGKDGTYDGVVVATINGVKTATAFTVTLGNTPTPPAPTPATLRNWVGKESAAKLAEHYRAWPAALSAVSTPQIFAKAEKAWREQAALSDAVKVYVEIDRRLNRAVAIEPWRECATQELLAIAAELEPLDTTPLVEPIPTTPDVVTAITYVFEKNQTAPPSEVTKALDRLNRDKSIKATMLEDPTNNENGKVAKQYERALAAAKKEGLPAIVVETADRVLRVVSDPRSQRLALVRSKTSTARHDPCDQRRHRSH
jgi:hypothetical protein